MLILTHFLGRRSLARVHLPRRFHSRLTEPRALSRHTYVNPGMLLLLLLLKNIYLYFRLTYTAAARACAQLLMNALLPRFASDNAHTHSRSLRRCLYICACTPLMLINPEASQITVFFVLLFFRKTIVARDKSMRERI